VTIHLGVPALIGFILVVGDSLLIKYRLSMRTSGGAWLLGRRNDHLAKLERIYVRTGELLLTVPFDRTSSRLDQYRDELYELRALWRREIESVLGIAPDPMVKEWWNHPDLKAFLARSPGLGWLLNGLVGWWGGNEEKTKRDNSWSICPHRCGLRLPLLLHTGSLRMPSLEGDRVLQTDRNAHLLMRRQRKSAAGETGKVIWPVGDS
jgi:hypothetical protein